MDTCRNICFSSVGSAAAAPTLNIFLLEDIFRINTLSASEDLWNMLRGGREPLWWLGGQGRRRGCEGSEVIPVTRSTPPGMCRVYHDVFITLLAGTPSRDPEDRGGAWVHCIPAEHIAKSRLGSSLILAQEFSSFVFCCVDERATAGP